MLNITYIGQTFPLSANETRLSIGFPVDVSPTPHQATIVAEVSAYYFAFTDEIVGLLTRLGGRKSLRDAQILYAKTTRLARPQSLLEESASTYGVQDCHRSLPGESETEMTEPLDVLPFVA